LVNGRNAMTSALLARSVLLLPRASTTATTKRYGSVLVKTLSCNISRIESSNLNSNATKKKPYWNKINSLLLKEFLSTDAGTHDDFEPKRKSVKGEDEALKMIEEHITNHHIMLYMKGTPSQPQCGFSSRVVKILQNESVDFSSVNVLDYPVIREAVKKYSDWPTIPQLYAGGIFIGGCDIISNLHDSGDLADVLKSEEKNDE